MPDCNGETTADLAVWILALPCEVRIPAELRDDLEKSGMAPTTYDDVRRYPRLLCGGPTQRGALEYRQTFPALVRQEGAAGVYIQDVSRGGCRFLHSELIYPGERLGIVLPAGLRRTIEVIWCRRLAERCFSVGARFAEPASAE